MRHSWGETVDIPTGYLNTASIGIPPGRVAEAMRTALERWAQGRATVAEYDPPVAAARQGYADLIGVPVSSVTIGGSASALIGLVAAAVPDGARVLVADDEFTSVTYPFVVHRPRGIVVDSRPLAELPGAAPGYDWVAVSVTQSKDGAMVDLDGLRKTTERAGARVLLDVTQTAGWMPLHLDWADAVVCAGYKWLLSPRGAAWMALRPDTAAGIRPLAANWYAGADLQGSMYGLTPELHADARRFDASPAWLSHVGAGVALPWLASLDLEAVRAHAVGLANRLRAGLGLPPGDSPILSLDGFDGASRTLDEAGVSHAVRGGSIRLSCHLYSTEEDVAAALAVLVR
ncbi:aminotransferase class V-fold PLP-dependent enzyme [uncultured Brevibacterium sp.]|mgnify:CR=1 FL=1|uniref:aminotransferase class V-fold PLP-dependent enzyme n=1 Tax=uncultured Brevibacterium sp. TaxID=189678 RepID=UPI0025F4AB7E|nr:aminotransferase class V-fold PLP-dependent enzyme [uncultured Brevibacterium sp.]